MKPAAVRTRTLVGAVWLLALLLAPRVARAAGSSFFQLEVDMVGAQPTGSFTSGARASDLFDLGPGFSLTASLGVGKRVFVALRSGLTKNEGDELVTAALGTQPTPYRSTRAEAVIFEARIHRKLTSIPTHLLAQYRYPVGSRLAFQGEGGVGVTSHTEDVEIRTTFDNPVIELSGRQTSFSYRLGAGASYGITRDLELVLGGAFEQARTSDGDLWRKGDNPQVLAASLGVRYPRR